MVNPVRALCEAQEVTIASGASLSPGINLSGRVLVGIYVPTWTSAGLSFQASNDGVTWSDMYAVTGEIALDAASGGYVAIDPMAFYGVKHLRVRSGTSAAPVNQGGARVLTLMIGQPAL